jgi:hypothetical protein
MRISAGRSYEGWLIAISLGGLLVAASLASGGVDTGPRGK